MNNLAPLRKNQGLNMKEVAEELDIPYTTYVSYEKGDREPNSEMLIRLAEFFNTSVDYLLGRIDDPTNYDDPDLIASIPLSYMELCDGDVRRAYKAMQAIDEENLKPPCPPNFLPRPKTRKVPRLGAIACGTPILASENLDGYDDVADYIQCDFTLLCKGDSMINARIFNGDIVCIRQQPEVENGEIAAVLIDGEFDGEATLKRVRMFDDHIILEPENPQYRPLSFWGDEMEKVHILGKATHFISAVK